MFGWLKADKALEEIASTSERKNHVSRRDFGLYALTALTGLAAACCDSGGGGDDGDDPVKPKDTVAPGQMDLEAYVSVNNGEELRLRWVSSGDDDWIGSPQYFIIKYSDQPIVTEDLWNAATDLASVTADGPAGTQYDMHFAIPAGTWYTAIKAVDEAGNESIISNYLPADPVDVKTKAEFYVDKWLPGGGFRLNYAESVDMFRGGSGINSYSDALAQILINADDSNGIPFASYATWQDIRDVLLQYTDGQPVTIPNSELVDATDATLLHGGTSSYICYINVNTGSAIETRLQQFNNLTQTEWDSIYDLGRNYLIERVAAKPEEYGGVPGGAPDPSFNPDW